MKEIVTEQESISALCFSLARDSQINSVLAPQGGSMITASFTLYQEILKDLYAFSPWKACELKKLNQMNFSFQYLDRKGQKSG